MVWTESLPALAIITGAVAASGFALNGIHSLFHDGKPRRMGVDKFDKHMIARDTVITGSKDKYGTAAQGEY
jgi:hypothetical protein